MNPSDLIWPLLGAALGTVVLGVFATAIFGSARKPQLSSALGAAFLVIFTVIMVAHALARPNSSVPTDMAQAGRMTQRVAVAISVLALAPNVTKPTPNLSVAPVPSVIPRADGPALPEVRVAAPTEVTVPVPAPRPAGTGQLTADDLLHYQDYRGDHYIRLGDAKIITKGGLYFLDLGTIAGLPNEIKISDHDQAKARKWLGE